MTPEQEKDGFDAIVAMLRELREEIARLRAVLKDLAERDARPLFGGSGKPRGEAP